MFSVIVQIVDQDGVRDYPSLHTYRTTAPMRDQMLDFDQPMT